MTPLDYSKTNPREGGRSFSRKHQLLRAAWGITWTFLGSWTPVPLHGWRRMLVRLFGGQIHPKAKIYPGSRIWYPPNLSMAEYACLGPQVNCYCMDKISLGPYALVSQGAYLCGGTHDVDKPSFQLHTHPISIGANAWIAAEAFVGPGVNVGEGAVLGARAVTMKSLDPWSIYAGNPAKFLRKRSGR